MASDSPDRHQTSLPPPTEQQQSGKFAIMKKLMARLEIAASEVGNKVLSSGNQQITEGVSKLADIGLPQTKIESSAPLDILANAGDHGHPAVDGTDPFPPAQVGPRAHWFHRADFSNVHVCCFSNADYIIVLFHALGFDFLIPS